MIVALLIEKEQKRMLEFPTMDKLTETITEYAQGYADCFNEPFDLISQDNTIELVDQKNKWLFKVKFDKAYHMPQLAIRLVPKP